MQNMRNQIFKTYNQLLVKTNFALITNNRLYVH